MRSRNWSLVVYDIDNFKEYIEKRLKFINHYVAIYHDLDGVMPHYHLAVNLSDSWEEKRVRDFFRSSDSSNCLSIDQDEKYKNRFHIVPYFLHRNEPEKTQYNDEDLISNDLSYYLEKSNDDFDKRRQLIEDFIGYVNNIDGCLSRRDLYIKYGRDVLINFDKYTEFAHLVLRDFRKNNL